MNAPSRMDQASIMRRLMQENTFQEGEKAYVISTSWLTKWKNAVGFDNKPPSGTVPPIDNRPLISNGVLKKALIKSTDYEIFSESIWKLFLKWYDGGPPIPVPVEYDPEKKCYIPVIKLTSFIVMHNDIKKTFHISKFKTIGDLKKLACKSFQLPPDAYRLYEIFKGKKDQPFNDSKIISTLYLKDGVVLILDAIANEEDPNKNNMSPSRRSPLKKTQNFNQSAPQSPVRQQNVSLSPNKNDKSPIRKNHQSIVKFDTENSIKVQNKQPYIGQQSSLIFTNTNNPTTSELLMGRMTKSQANFNTGSSCVCGLVNLGNTCFFNSALQCLLHCTPLINYMKSGKYRQDLAPNNPLGTKCQLVKSFASLINEIFTQNVGVTAPRELFSTLTSFSTHFQGFSQQDAHELLFLLLDLLHEDMNRAKNKPKPDPSELEEITGDGTDDMKTAKLRWEQYKKVNDSIIVDLFHGLHRSQLTCPQCKKVSVIFEPFVTMSLPIPGPTLLYPEFTFVPYDPLQPKQKMSLPLSFGIDAVSFKRNLTIEIGRDFEIAFGVRSGAEIEWFANPPNRRYANLIVFEIPDTEKLYTVASINMFQKGSMLFNQELMLDDLILVPISRQFPSQEELENACLERLSYLWDSNHRNPVEDPQKIINIMSQALKFPENDKKLIVKVNNTILDQSVSLVRFKPLPFVSSKSIKIYLNPFFMNDNYGFNWCNLFRKTNHVEPVKRETIEPTLENCLKQFSIDIALDSNNKWYCPNCKQFVCADKKTSIWFLPKCLVFQFKRFTQVYDSYRKNDIRVEFPDEIDFAPFIQGPVDSSKTKYKLYAVCEHYGTMFDGHYTAHAYVEEKKSWYLFNDSSCKPTPSSAAHNSAAYLLFYELIE